MMKMSTILQERMMFDLFFFGNEKYYMPYYLYDNQIITIHS